MKTTDVDPEAKAIEARLRAYRPSGPAERLRGAVLALAASRKPRPPPGWLTLAALLLLAVTLRWSARFDVAMSNERSPEVLLLAGPSLEAGVDPKLARALLGVAEKSRAEFIGALTDPRLMGVER